MTVNSMTGFGSSEGQYLDTVLVVEIKSVNGRFLDIVYRAPKIYSSLELKVRQIIEKSVKRGRVEIAIDRIKVKEVNQTSNEENSKAFLSEGMRLGKLLGLKESDIKPLIFSELLKGRASVNSEEDGELSEDEANLLLSLCTSAIKDNINVRRSEGERLSVELKTLVIELENLVREVKSKVAVAPNIIKERIVERLKSLAPEIQLDPLRIVMEAAIVADRVDVREEIARLESHIKFAFDLLGGEANGKKLDFLSQEFLRELNTIGSKCQSAEIQRIIVETKGLVEQIKEQVQNIE